MRNRRFIFAALAVAVTAAIVPAHSSQDNRKPVTATNLSGLHDFDTQVGKWLVHHRRLKERLAGSHEWVDFEGTQTFWKVMNGFGNVDDNVLSLPGGEYRAVTVRAYDPQTAQWAIWWLDGRDPFGELDPPVKGRFEHGVGTFYSTDTLRGKTIRVRFVWSRMTPTSAHWEQSFSPDGGKTWELNWVSDFRRPGGANQ